MFPGWWKPQHRPVWWLISCSRVRNPIRKAIKKSATHRNNPTLKSHHHPKTIVAPEQTFFCPRRCRRPHRMRSWWERRIEAHPPLEDDHIFYIGNIQTQINTLILRILPDNVYIYETTLWGLNIASARFKNKVQHLRERKCCNCGCTQKSKRNIGAERRYRRWVDQQ